jgi:hypothetical protein
MRWSNSTALGEIVEGSNEGNAETSKRGGKESYTQNANRTQRINKQKKVKIASVSNEGETRVYHQPLYFPGKSNEPGLSYNNELLLFPNNPPGLSESVPIRFSSSSRSVRGS